MSTPMTAHNFTHFLRYSRVRGNLTCCSQQSCVIVYFAQNKKPNNLFQFSHRLIMKHDRMERWNEAEFFSPDFEGKNCDLIELSSHVNTINGQRGKLRNNFILNSFHLLASILRIENLVISALLSAGSWWSLPNLSGS